MIRNRLVCGCNNERIQKRLLSEKDLTYEKAMELALAMEAADKDTQELKQAGGNTTTTAQSATGSTSTVTPESVHYESLNSEKGGKTDKKVCCYRCGGNHLATGCHFKEAECRSCGKKGHLARMCRSTPSSSQSGKKKKFRRKNNRIEEAESEADTSDVEYTMFALKNPKSKDPIMMNVQLEGVPVQMELDTGASLSVIG